MMRKRLFELVALGPELRDEAARHGKSVNESYLVVHRVLSRAFQEDPRTVPSEGLRAHLKKRLRDTLLACA
jgi:hypothetical protein